MSHCKDGIRKHRLFRCWRAHTRALAVSGNFVVSGKECPRARAQAQAGTALLDLGGPGRLLNEREVQNICVNKALAALNLLC